MLNESPPFFSMPLIREFRHQSRCHPRIRLTLSVIRYFPLQIVVEVAVIAEFACHCFATRTARFSQQCRKEGSEQRQARPISGFSVLAIRRCHANSLAREDLIVDFTR